jgi:hypothetical protein
MAEEQVESNFFEKEKRDTGTGLFKPYKTLSVPVKIGIVGAALLVFGVIIYLIPKAPDATLWVINPAPESFHLSIAGDSHDLDSGRLLETTVKVEDDFEVGAFRGEQAEDIRVELRPEKQGVSLVDLGGDAAYVVLDVSPAYGASSDKPTTFRVVHVSQPAKAHFLPFPALKLVRPGRDIPEKGSWELKAAQGAKSTIELYKVARVDPKRLQDQEELAKTLSSAVTSKSVKDYENMRSFIDMKRPTTHDGVVPNVR